jgi:hypothetical protein
MNAYKTGVIQIESVENIQGNIVLVVHMDSKMLPLGKLGMCPQDLCVIYYNCMCISNYLTIRSSTF